MRIPYPDNLPVVAQKDKIIQTLRDHRVVVIAGDTGSGKTTQLPKMCLEAFGVEESFIGCTQPRRIAASSVATRVAEELGPYGNIVGYKIRFHDKTSAETRIKFMTDGILLAETRQDRDLRKYSVIIIDEAHERSLNIDFLLGYLKQLLTRRDDLRLIITSATIDTESFSRHFDNAPIINVTGRTYPVDIRYLPPDAEEDEDTLENCINAVVNICEHEPPGDVLVFLPTEQEIRECCQILQARLDSCVVLPLFGRLSGGDQRKIFQQYSKQKIVVATNVAETSITVPGIRYVVDSGLARISYYNARAKTTSLPITRVSRASCDQRKGRCGRIGPGICIRLYSEEDFLDRPEHTLPELKRSNLAEVILQMIDLQLGHPAEFPFLDPPFKNAVREGYRMLLELGALDAGMNLTRIGRIMADLPIDPCISRVIIAARENNCLKEIKILSAVLAIQDPRIRPAEHEKEADAAHTQFAHPHSDFMAFLNLWSAYFDRQDDQHSWSKLKKFCKSNYLSFQRMREWFDLYGQLERILKSRDGFTNNETAASYENIHQALLYGFLRNIAHKKTGKIYQGTQNKELMIFPGSHQFMRSGDWIVAATFIETSRLYGLTVATIEPEWLEKIAGHLCKRSWSDPAWHKKSGKVLASETVSLFGLLISSGKKVDYARRHKKNVPEARDIFIHEGLINGQLNGNYPFLSHNLTLLTKWRETEDRLRVRNIVADETILFAYYDKKLPSEVFDQLSLNQHLKRKRQQRFLMMSDQDIANRTLEDSELLNFPKKLHLGGIDIRLDYNFEPGSESDGITFRLPAAMAPLFSADYFDWLVPGLLPEKLTFLLKGLPKSIRKKLVPINETVNVLLDDLEPYKGSLYGAVEAAILKYKKLLVGRSEWSTELPAHLMPRFVLFNEAGNEVLAGRNLTTLREELERLGAHQPNLATAAITAEQNESVKQWENRIFTEWDFAALPDSIPLFTKQGEAVGYLFPTLNINEEQSGVTISFDRDIAAVQKKNITGLLFLLRRTFHNQYKALKKFCNTAFTGPSCLWLLGSGPSKAATIMEILDYILTEIFAPLPTAISDKGAFDAATKRAEEKGFYASGEAILQEILALLRQRRALDENIKKIFGPTCKRSHYLPQKRREFTECLEEILPRDFFSTKGTMSLRDRARYMQGLEIRLQRFYADPGKDQQKADQLAPFLDKLKSLDLQNRQLTTEAEDMVAEYRELLQEYRISLFSPEVKTKTAVSPKKLLKHWQATQAMS